MKHYKSIRDTVIDIQRETVEIIKLLDKLGNIEIPIGAIDRARTIGISLKRITFCLINKANKQQLETKDE